jgi:hypothetical protein
MRHFFTTRVATTLLLITLVTGSCTVVGTLNPIYSNPKEFVIKKELVGKWVDTKDMSGHLIVDTLVSDLPKSYNLYMISKNDEGKIKDTTHFVGHLINNNGSYFLECWYNIDYDLVDLVIPRHFLANISFIGKNRIEFSFPDAERLIKLIDEKKLQLNYAERSEGKEDNEKSFLITNKTPALRRAFNAMKKYPELFKDKVTLTRSE